MTVRQRGSRRVGGASPGPSAPAAPSRGRRGAAPDPVEGVLIPKAARDSSADVPYFWNNGKCPSGTCKLNVTMDVA